MDRLGWFLIVVGSVLTVAAVVLTVAGLAAIRDFRRTLREAHVVFSRARRLVDHLQHATRPMTRIVHHASAVAGDALNAVAAWKARASQWFGVSSIRSRSRH